MFYHVTENAGHCLAVETLRNALVIITLSNQISGEPSATPHGTTESERATQLASSETHIAHSKNTKFFPAACVINTRGCPVFLSHSFHYQTKPFLQTTLSLSP